MCQASHDAEGLTGALLEYLRQLLARELLDEPAEPATPEERRERPTSRPPPPPSR